MFPDTSVSIVGDQSPQVVIFELGINDCFGANAESLATIDKTIDSVFAHAEKLLAAFHEAAPQARLGICVTTPGNSRPAAFVANYGERYPRTGWEKIQQQLVHRQLQQYQGREDENIFVIPTHLHLDTTAGYPENNSVHPNTTGYHQMAASIYAWLKNVGCHP